MCETWNIRIYVSHHYMVLITDTPWLVRKGDTWGVPCESKFGLMYCITTRSSQQTSHCSSVRAMHGAPPVSSISNWCITSLQDPHNIHPMARSQGQHTGRLLRVQILIDVDIITGSSLWWISRTKVGILDELLVLMWNIWLHVHYWSQNYLYACTVSPLISKYSL